MSVRGGPATPHKMTGYIRVSRVAGRDGESFISPDVQRKQIEGWAAMSGVEIVDWQQDLDVSGGKRNRPGLDAFMEALKANETHGIVVARLDRLSRLGVGDALGLVEEIHDLGGSIAAIDLGIDPTTPFGELAMTLMLALARMERRRMVEGWAVAQARAVARGVHIGPTPFGYHRDEASGLLVLDPTYAPIVQKAFDVASTQGLSATVRYLKDHGAQPRGGDGQVRNWSSWHARRFLSTRAYLGEVTTRDWHNPDAHPPLVDRATFEAAQPLPARPKALSAAFPLSGIVKCAGCGGTISGTSGGKPSRRMYRCANAANKYSRNICCDPVNTSADPLEAHIRARLVEAFRGPGLYVGGDDPQERIQAAQEALEAAEAARLAYAQDADLQTVLGLEAWKAGAVERAERVNHLAEQLATASLEATSLQTISRPEVIESATDAELAEILSSLVRADVLDMSVARGRAPLGERVRVVLS